MIITASSRVAIRCLAASCLALAMVVANVTLAEEGQKPAVQVKAEAEGDTVSATAQNEPMPLPPQSGDFGERLTRLERQIDRLTHEIEALRAIIGGVDVPGGRPDLRSTDDSQPTRNEKKPAPPRNMHLTDRWNSDDNRFSQGNLSGARQRSAANLRQQQDRQQSNREAAPAGGVNRDAQRSATQRDANTKRTNSANDKSSKADHSQKPPTADEYKTPGELSNPADPANTPDEK